MSIFYINEIAFGQCAMIFVIAGILALLYPDITREDKKK